MYSLRSLFNMAVLTGSTSHCLLGQSVKRTSNERVRIASASLPKAPEPPTEGAAPRNVSPEALNKGSDTLPMSFFDAITGKFIPMTSSVEVHAIEQGLETASTAPFQAGGQDVLTLAGSWGDISRYAQILPGVISSATRAIRSWFVVVTLAAQKSSYALF